MLPLHRNIGNPIYKYTDTCKYNKHYNYSNVDYILKTCLSMWLNASHAFAYKKLRYIDTTRH